MITEKDLQEAIAECLGQRNPNADTAAKLAAFLTIRRELFGNSEQLVGVDTGHSYAAEPPETYPRTDTVGSYGDSDFLRAIAGKNAAAMWMIMDELMDTLKMVNGRVYSGVLRRIR